MAILVTPAQLSARSDFYHQIGTSVAAGLGLVQTLRILSKSPPSPGLRRRATRVADRLEAGSTASEAFRSLGSFVPPFDLSLIEAGEQTGRIDRTCLALAQSYAARAALARQILMGLAYPILVFHVAFLILPVQYLVALVRDGDGAGFLRQKILFFVPVYLATFGFIFLLQRSQTGVARSAFEGVTALIPVLGRARRALALSRLSLALDALLNAGVNAARAWPLAGAASGSPALHRELARWGPRIADGVPASELLLQSSRFPPHFSHIYATAEMSGQVDDALPRLVSHYQEEGLRLMRVAAGILIGVVYGGILLIVAYQIVSFWLGFYGQILNEV
ncbi:MAG: type II secretion system F family protein [Limisphaerales bacterium]